MALTSLHPPKQRSRRPTLAHPPLPLEAKPHLGLAGNLARFFTNLPLTPLLMLATLAVGILGLLVTPRQEDPQISVPMVDIFFEYPGAPAEQVANLAVALLERMMSEIPGVKHVYSTSQRESSLVTVRFEVGEPLGPSIVKVHDELQSNMDKIPLGVSMPLVQPKGVDDVPVVTVTLWPQRVYDVALRSLAYDVLQHLKEVPETGTGFVVGGRRTPIRVEVLPEQLAGFSIGYSSAPDLVSSFSKAVRPSIVYPVKLTPFFTRLNNLLIVGLRPRIPQWKRLDFLSFDSLLVC